MKNTPKLSTFYAYTCICICICASVRAEDTATNNEQNCLVRLQLTNTLCVARSMVAHLNHLKGTTSDGNAQTRNMINDIDALGIDIASTNGFIAIASAKRAKLLIDLTRLYTLYGRGAENIANPTPIQKQAIDQIRKTRYDLMEAMAIPIWNGSNWVDGRCIAFNIRDLPVSVKKMLVRLNWLDQNFGTCAFSTGGEVASGPASASIDLLRSQLERTGVALELDQSVRIWKIKDKREGKFETRAGTVVGP